MSLSISVVVVVPGSGKAVGVAACLVATTAAGGFRGVAGIAIGGGMTFVGVAWDFAYVGVSCEGTRGSRKSDTAWEAWSRANLAAVSVGWRYSCVGWLLAKLEACR